MLENRALGLGQAVYDRVWSQLRLGKGDRGQEVKELQRALVTWMPSWKGKLAVDGDYGPETAAALDTFKRCYGLGKDGNSLDARTARALRTYRSQPRPLARPRLYEKARKHGFPFDREQRIRELATRQPRSLVQWQGHPMQAATAVRYVDFMRKVENCGYKPYITATTGGVHSSSAHGEGRAVDVVIEDPSGRPITSAQSWQFARLAEQSQLSVFNEYVYDSRYQTGPHLHLEGP